MVKLRLVRRRLKWVAAAAALLFPCPAFARTERLGGPLRLRCSRAEEAATAAAGRIKLFGVCLEAKKKLAGLGLDDRHLRSVGGGGGAGKKLIPLTGLEVFALKLAIDAECIRRPGAQGGLRARGIELRFA